MTTMTPEDAIKAAASVARDVADGKLSPADLEAQAVAECRELFGTVIGEGDALWTLHADVARQAVSLGALSADELSEWAAVMRHKAGEAVEPPAPHYDPLPAVSLASVDESQPDRPTMTASRTMNPNTLRCRANRSRGRWSHSPPPPSRLTRRLHRSAGPRRLIRPVARVQPRRDSTALSFTPTEEDQDMGNNSGLGSDWRATRSNRGSTLRRRPTSATTGACSVRTMRSSARWRRRASRGGVPAAPVREARRYRRHRRAMRLILGAIERGELEATATERTRLEGAVAALDALTGDAPAV